VKSRNGPAAVTGNERCIKSLSEMEWEDAASKMIRESENLPEWKDPFLSARLDWIENAYSEDKYGIPYRLIVDVGFFLLDNTRYKPLDCMGNMAVK